MYLYTSSWGERKTFKMIPASAECPFLECIFNPDVKVLAVIAKATKDGFVMVPKLDINGVAEPVKTGKSVQGADSKMERKSMAKNFEYYIEEESEIKAFIAAFAVNSEFDIQPFFKTATPIANIEIKEPVTEVVE